MHIEIYIFHCAEPSESAYSSQTLRRFKVAILHINAFMRVVGV